MCARLFPPLLVLAVAVGLASLDSPSTSAQDKKDEKKANLNQKAAAVAAIKKADLPKVEIVETDNFIIGSTLSEEKAKALGATLEKVVPVARKGLQYEDKEEAWKGKLAVYYLPETRDFKSFMRNFVGEKPEGVFYSLRSDDPYIVDPADSQSKSTDGDKFANTAASVAQAHIKARGNSANLPDWLTEAFGRVTAMRAEGLSSKRYTAYKSAAKPVVLGTKAGKPPAIADLWAETKPDGADMLANSLAEYLAYGPGKNNFLKLISGFRPGENGAIPTPAQAFESAGWKDLTVLETALRKWVQSGK
jgi:hypothetical protein